MLRLIELPFLPKLSLEAYASDARFAAVVRDLKGLAALATKGFRGTAWMVSSTAEGGGVAEMLPGLIQLLSELGVPTRWVVIGSERPEFFRLTKRLHNLMHAQLEAGPQLGADDMALLEQVGRENASALAPLLTPDDVLVVHDPQPLAVGSILRREHGVRALWRCHIGVDDRNLATSAAWTFLRPLLADYERAAFSAPEYFPSFLADRAQLLYPGIDPGSHKNRELPISKLVGILCNAGLQTAHEPVPTEPFTQPARRLAGRGHAAPPPGDIGLLFRPIVLQVSRWDRLKGFAPLMLGFVRMKQLLREGAWKHVAPVCEQRLALSRLILAGPDPEGVADDPEAADLLAELSSIYGRLRPDLRRDVALLVLPMQSRKENALMVNALQRCATLVVQNSLREGFGLTVTEAMWKRQAVLGTHAVGIRQQIRHGIEGRLTQDPTNPDEIAWHIAELLIEPDRRQEMGRSAQRRVYDNFLVFTQAAGYLELITAAARRRERA